MRGEVVGDLAELDGAILLLGLYERSRYGKGIFLTWVSWAAARRAAIWTPPARTVPHRWLSSALGRANALHAQGHVGFHGGRRRRDAAALDLGRVPATAAR